MISGRHERKDFLRSQSVVRKRRKKRIVRWSIRVSLCVALVVSLALLSQIEFFAIKSIVISGNSNIPTEEVQTIVDTAIHTSYLGLFPKTNVFLYPKSMISENLSKKFPRIKSIQVYTESFNILNVRITERTPTAVWCSAIQCYLVDETAYIYAEDQGGAQGTESIVLENMSLLAFTGLDEHVGSAPIGNVLLDIEAFSKILQVVQDMEKIHLPVETVEFRSKDEVNFWIRGVTGEAVRKKIIFSSRKDYQESFDNLNAALKSNALATTTDFEYIDTRFGNKVFYRLAPSKVVTPTSTGSKKR